MTFPVEFFVGRSLYFIAVTTVVILHLVLVDSVSAVCEFSLTDNSKVYNYNLGSPIANYPHGVRSEDGFYKVAVNGTVLWFQLCDLMIFNHDQPKCLACGECGGSSHCGMGCSALVSNNVGGYHVCTTVGHTSSMTIDLIDKSTPHAGVVVKMSSGSKCSLSVSVICDSKEVQGPRTLNRTGNCNYATQLKHPTGCATIISSHGKVLGWFGTLLIIILCLFGAYLLVGTVYRYFFLHIRGIDIIPNLELWASLPHRVKEHDKHCCESVSNCCHSRCNSKLWIHNSAPFRKAGVYSQLYYENSEDLPRATGAPTLLSAFKQAHIEFNYKAGLGMEPPLT